MTSPFSYMTSSSKFFWRCFVSLMKFSYWSKFHVNIIIGSGVMTIFFYKGLTRNAEIGNTPIWVLSNIWRLGQVGDTKFGANVSNKMSLNAAKYKGHIFYRFWVIKGKSRGRVKLPPPPPPRLGLRARKVRNVINFSLFQMFRFFSSWLIKIFIPKTKDATAYLRGIPSCCLPSISNMEFPMFLFPPNTVAT